MCIGLLILLRPLKNLGELRIFYVYRGHFLNLIVDAFIATMHDANFSINDW